MQPSSGHTVSPGEVKLSIRMSSREKAENGTMVQCYHVTTQPDLIHAVGHRD